MSNPAYPPFFLQFDGSRALSEPSGPGPRLALTQILYSQNSGFEFLSLPILVPIYDNIFLQRKNNKAQTLVTGEVGKTPAAQT